MKIFFDKPNEQSQAGLGFAVARKSGLKAKAVVIIAVLCGIGLTAGCKGGHKNGNTADTTDTVPQYKEAEDVYLDGKDTEYVLIFPSDRCFEDMLREIGGDSAGLDDFYVAQDDLGYYYYMCGQRLDAMDVKHYETSADKKVFCRGNLVFAPLDSCSCGVLIVQPNGQCGMVDVVEFACPTDDNNIMQITE